MGFDMNKSAPICLVECDGKRLSIPALPRMLRTGSDGGLHLITIPVGGVG